MPWREVEGRAYTGYSQLSISKHEAHVRSLRYEGEMGGSIGQHQYRRQFCRESGRAIRLLCSKTSVFAFSRFFAIQTVQLHFIEKHSEHI